MKPAYNSVDMVDVELVDDDREPRDYDEVLIEVKFMHLKLFILLKLLFSFFTDSRKHDQSDKRFQDAQSEVSF